ncbi:MAG: hypothetical protein ACLU99_08680 [Alphaproteobacteria bacterium]
MEAAPPETDDVSALRGYCFGFRQVTTAFLAQWMGRFRFAAS